MEVWLVGAALWLVHLFLGPWALLGVLLAACALGWYFRCRLLDSDAFVDWYRGYRLRRRLAGWQKQAHAEQIASDERNREILQLQQVADRARLVEMPHHEFIEFTVRYFRLMGYGRLYTAFPEARGVDAVLKNAEGLQLLACRQMATLQTNEVTVRDLLDAITWTKAAGGIIVSTTGFTPAARELAEACGVTLLDTDQLLGSILTLQITDPARRVSPAPTHQLSTRTRSNPV
ncbi:MAG: hypothetical protein AMXMBFR13_37020 [Phycisphaerae bacterium]